MNDDWTFIQAIRDEPHELLPRLIYADFLEAQGNLRGELIRVQCELTTLPPGDPARAALTDRERELLESHGEEWLAPPRALGVEGVTVKCFERGLIEQVRISAADFVRNGRELCEMMPALRRVELRHIKDALDELAPYDPPPQITELDLSAAGLNAETIIRLGDAELWRELQVLDLSFNRLEPGNVLPQLVTIDLPELKALSLSANRITVLGASSLTEWPTLAKLEHLDFSNNPLGQDGLDQLASSGALDRLKSLNIASCQFNSFSSLIAREHLLSLTEINARSNRIDKDAWTLWANSELSERITTVDIRNNYRPTG